MVRNTAYDYSHFIMPGRGSGNGRATVALACQNKSTYD